jgi:LPPG:FO 2-phospho-L-lactate transferase
LGLLRNRVGIICGGSGSSKFATAISKYSIDKTLDVGFISNVGDNFWFHGLLVCPDIDIITYALSNLLDTRKGWGVLNDRLLARETLSRSSGSDEWFNLGDRDLAVSLRRTELLRKGWNLSSITKKLGSSFHATFPVIPSTDDAVQTFVGTQEGMLHLQEYWVKNRAAFDAISVEFVGIETAKPSAQCLEYLKDRVLICPANPVTSILPTISLKGVVSRLKKAKVAAVSPFVGNKPFSGPAGKMMNALNLEATSLGVARLYSDFLKVFFLDNNEDQSVDSKINDLGIECIRTNTRIENESEGMTVTMELMSVL